jgi:hypothetical protein
LISIDLENSLESQFNQERVHENSLENEFVQSPVHSNPGSARQAIENMLSARNRYTISNFTTRNTFDAKSLSKNR